MRFFEMLDRLLGLMLLATLVIEAVRWSYLSNRDPFQMVVVAALLYLIWNIGIAQRFVE